MTVYSPDKATHFTIFFHSFVLMQIFNEFNSRKSEITNYNIFEGLLSDKLFMIIMLVTFKI